MIVLRTPKGWTGLKTIDGTRRGHVPRPFFRMNDMEKPDAWLRG